MAMKQPSKNSMSKCLSLMTITLTMLLLSCASTDKINAPVVDKQGVDPEQYETDLADCRDYAEQVNTAYKSGAGAIGGAVTGGLVGVIFDGSKGAAKGAGTGAVLGGAKGTGDGIHERAVIIKNCLRKRGYTVLN